MAEHILMIALSPTMETGTIVSWNKAVGDSVSSGDVLCEVETDKATMEYESMQEGVLLDILVPGGGEAEVGTPIAIIGQEGEDISSLQVSVKAEKEAEPTSQQPSSRAEPTEPHTPPKAEPSVPKTETASISLKRADQAEYVQFNTPPSPMRKGVRVYASPVARLEAEKNGIDLSAVPGSGPGGRIIKRDVEQALNSPDLLAAKKDHTTMSRAETTKILPWIAMEEKEIPVAGKRKVIAARLSESKFNAPHFYLKSTVDVDHLLEIRSDLNQRLSREGIKISFNAYLIKLAAETLKYHRRVNAGWFGETIKQFGTVDIGLAVATDEGEDTGLITPIVRDCTAKGIRQIDSELQELIGKAKTGSLTPEEYTGATFTISNLGSFGIEEFTAIINPPGSAILAVGSAEKQPVVVKAPSGEDEIAIRTRMKLTLSCDHRVIDGSAGAAFLTNLKQVIEHPIEGML